MATLADNCNHKNIDVCMRSRAMRRKQILNAKANVRGKKSHSKNNIWQSANQGGEKEGCMSSIHQTGIYQPSLIHPY